MQRVREQVEHGLLQLGVEVDEQVPANHEVDSREGNAAAQILCSEDDPLAEHLAHPEPLIGALEILRSVFLRQVLEDVRRIESAAGVGDGILVHVGREDLDAPLGKLLAQHVGEQEHEGVRLLPGGAPRGPEAKHATPLPAGLDQFRHHF
jgi:hypothetical protein